MLTYEEQELNRYDMILTTRCGEGWQELQPEPEGEWVRFDDVGALLAERDRLRSALEGKDEWISVLDKLPDDRTPVLVYAEYWSRFAFVAHLNHGLWTGEAILSEPANVTHWQPLPAPPRGLKP